MDAHALRTLEFDKILAKLARHTSFSAGRELALALEPSPEYREVVRRQRETAEARRLLAPKPRTGLGGAPHALLNIATTLECARDLKTSVQRLEDLPLLKETVDLIEPMARTIEDINR